MSQIASVWLKTDRELLEVSERVTSVLRAANADVRPGVVGLSTDSRCTPGQVVWQVRKKLVVRESGWPDPYDAHDVEVDVVRRGREAPPDDDAVWFVREIAPLLGWQAMTIRDHSPGPDLVWTPTHGHAELDLSVPDLSEVPPWVF